MMKHLPSASFFTGPKYRTIVFKLESVISPSSKKGNEVKHKRDIDIIVVEPKDTAIKFYYFQTFYNNGTYNDFRCV